MAQFQSLYNQGINQDASRENYPRGAYLNLANGRLIPETDLAAGNISSLKGNEVFIPSLLDRTFPSKTTLANDFISGDYKYFTDQTIEDLNGLDDYEAEVSAYITSLPTWETVRPIG